MQLPHHWYFSRTINALEILLFTRHLATMVRAGVPVAESLSTLADQTKSVRFKRILVAVLADITNGQSLANSMKKHPEAFDQFYISLIAVSEKTGLLDENLTFIAQQLGKNYRLKKKIQTATLYPTLVVIAAVTMGGFISFFVLPQLVGFFEAFDVELPLATRILLFIANLVKDHGLLIIFAVVAAVVSLRMLTGLNSIKPRWHKMLLRLPVMGEFLTTAQLAQCTRNLGILLKSGLPVTSSIEITAGTLSNFKFRYDLLAIGEALSKGTSIATAMEKGHYSEFSPLVAKMIAVGEKTGSLDESLLYLGDFYEEEVDAMGKNVTAVLEPLLMLVIGLGVGFLALAIISPIYELTGSIRR